MVAKRGASWGKSNGSLNNISSLPFMDIRFRSLGKALDELRTKRVQLDEDLRKGHIDQSDYASQLLNIIVETNSLNKERKEVEDRVTELRSNKLH
jgi:septation ring formation regulator EzrA